MAKIPPVKPIVWRRFHLVMTFVWIGLLVPSLLFWKNSITWVVLMSVYACFTGHFAAWQGARSEDNNK